MKLENAVKQINASKPLVICDVDEVLINLLDPLRDFLHTHDYTIDLTSHNFGQTIKKSSCGSPIEKHDIMRLVDVFFDACIEKLPFYDGALKALQILEQDCQLIILTNLPHKFGDRRRQFMQNFGVAYPLITNEGGKGPTVKQLAAATTGKVIFIDDTPLHHGSVAEHAPDVHRLHFIAHPELAASVPKAEHCHARIDCWEQATDHMLNILQKD